MNQRLLKNGENINSQNITLFCFPFAGGGASAYNSWVQKMKDTITVCPIQLPGREERIMEKPIIVSIIFLLLYLELPCSGSGGLDSMQEVH